MNFNLLNKNININDLFYIHSKNKLGFTARRCLTAQDLGHAWITFSSCADNKINHTFSHCQGSLKYPLSASFVSPRSKKTSIKRWSLGWTIQN